MDENKETASVLLKKASECEKSEDAMKFSQAALNCSHCLQVMAQVKDVSQKGINIMVRAKFRVESKKRSQHWEGRVDINMQPVCSDVEGSENKQFWEATPAGDIQLSTVNPKAAEQFEVGQEYYVDFTKA